MKKDTKACPDCGKLVKAKGFGAHKRFCGKGKMRWEETHADMNPRLGNAVNELVGSEPNGNEVQVAIGHAHNVECPHCGGELHIVPH